MSAAGNTNSKSAGGLVDRDLVNAMGAFNSLPAAVRRALAANSENYDPVLIASDFAAMRGAGCPAEEIARRAADLAARIRANDRTGQLMQVD